MTNLRLNPLRYGKSENETIQIRPIWNSNHSGMANLEVKPLRYDQSETQTTLIWPIWNSTHSGMANPKFKPLKVWQMWMSSFRVFICSCPKVSNLKVKLLGYDQSESQTTRYRLDFWVSATPEDPLWVSLGGQAFFKGLQCEWGRWGRGDRQWQVKKCTPALSKKESLKLV